MDLAMLALPVALCGAGALAWFAFRHRLAGAALDEAAGRARRAQSLGWFYDDHADGEVTFVLKGEDAGVKWKVLFRDGPDGEETRPTLTWASRSVQGSATELRLIGRERYLRGKANIEPAIERLSSLILSARDIAQAQERASFLARTPPAEVGSPAFRTGFVVIARNQRLARALVDGKSERLLTDWPTQVKAQDTLSAWLDWQGLRIDVEGRHTSMPAIEHLVSLGIELATRYRRQAAAPGVTVFMSTEPGAKPT